MARSLDATVQPFTVDDQDVTAIVEFAERRTASGMGGESSRWQEAGYWITPAIALVVALSFRRQQAFSAEGRR
jgi:Ca-activated chloride channel family protein